MPSSTTHSQQAAPEHYREALRTYFRRRLGAHADVADLVQEVLLRLLNRRPEGDIHHLSGYVFQIAANLLRERARQAARRSSPAALHLTPGLLEGDQDLSAERIEEAREACSIVEHALRELPDRVRSVFILNRFEELSGPEVARRLGVSLSTVEKDMARALTHLKDKLR